jgi:signal transduction histidine kinase
VNLLCERFNLYHTHVYTLDGKRLRLRAGYGKAGQVMLEEGHTIPLNREQSLVARAARSREIIVAQDVTQEPGFMPNPLLPETKAEIAVPLVIGDEVLGVFDAQAREVGRFIERDIDVFRTLAGQLATAVQNAVYVEELQRTTNRLREVDRLKSEFLANMSHELRTPLNSIIGYAEIMMMGIDGDMDPETLEDIKAIYENGQHLLAMINDILDLAKIEAGRLTLKFEEDVDLTQVLEESESSNASLFANKPVDLRLVIEDELPNIRADRLRLHQIFNNLISNAQKFTPEGHVEVRAYPQGSHWVCVTVEDTGIGIAEEDIAGIFERFEQIDGSSTRSADGTGLGLAITRELVQMHGGRIEVESEVDVGSKFTVWLPIEE